MIGDIALKETLVSLKTVRFIIAILICCLLMPLSVWVLSSDYRRDLDDYDGRIDLEARRTQGKNMSITVNRPVPPLSPLFRGALPESANSVNLKYYLSWNYPVAAATQSITSDIFPTVDLTFIIGAILSALALMFSFDAISGEKADATLRLIMSNPVARYKVIIGKWLGLSGALLIPFIIGIILSLLVFFTISGVSLTGGNWLALIIALVAALIYLALFILIGIVISAFTRNPSVAIFICLGVWGLLTILLPQSANAAASALSPVPPPQKIEKDIRNLYTDMANAIRNYNMELVDRAKRTGMEYQKMDQQRNENEFKLATKNRVDANDVEREYWLQIATQEQTGKMISYISPFGCLNQVLISMANTGPEGQRAFLRQSYSYGERFFSDIWSEALFSNQNSTWEKIISAQPKFKYDEINIEHRIGASIIPLGLLIVFNIVLLIVGVIAYNRYDVR